MLGHQREQFLNPPAAVLKVGQFCSPHSARLSEEKLKVVGPFYLVSVGEVKDPTRGKCVICRGVVVSISNPLIPVRGTEQAVCTAVMLPLTPYRGL